MHQDIYVVRSSKVKTRSGRFDSSEIGCRIVFHAGRSFLDVQFRDFDTFPAARRGYAISFTCAANEPAKRFARDIEPSESRCLICLCVFPERSAASISNKREQRRAVFVVGGSAASFSKVSR